MEFTTSPVWPPRVRWVKLIQTRRACAVQPPQRFELLWCARSLSLLIPTKGRKLQACSRDHPPVHAGQRSGRWVSPPCIETAAGRGHTQSPRQAVETRSLWYVPQGVFWTVSYRLRVLPRRRSHLCRVSDHPTRAPPTFLHKYTSSSQLQSSLHPTHLSKPLYTSVSPPLHSPQ